MWSVSSLYSGMYRGRGTSDFISLFLWLSFMFQVLGAVPVHVSELLICVTLTDHTGNEPDQLVNFVISVS